MKYFIDCGANHGQGLQEFNEKFRMFNDPTWVIHSIEPNPDIQLDFTNISNATAHVFAVWNKDETLTFARNILPSHAAKDYNEQVSDGFGAKATVGTATSCGSRLLAGDIQNVNGAGEILENFVEVPALDFDAWLRSMVPADAEKVVVKIDIEGAEYTVLPHMLEKNTFDLIDEVYVETHHRFVEGWDANSTERLLQSVRATGTAVHHWV